MHAANAPRRGRLCTDQQRRTPPQHRQQNAQHYPHAHDQTARRHPPTHAAHTHTAQIRHPAAHAGSRAAPAALHDQPPDSTKARPTIKPDRLFLLYDGTEHCPTDTIGKDHTARPPPALHAASMFRWGDHPQIRRRESHQHDSSHHAHDQTAHAPAGRPVHAAPVLVMGKSPADTAQHAQQPHPDRPQISQPEPPHPRRRASEVRHSIRHTARHFFKSKAQIRHIPAILHPL